MIFSSNKIRLKQSAESRSVLQALVLTYMPDRNGPVYRGQVLRPFGGPLFRHPKHTTPIALKALQRRPKGPGTRRALKPYASYLLRLEAPFVDQPIAVATNPVLKRLSLHWASAWRADNLNGLNQRLVLTKSKQKIWSKRLFVHGVTAGTMVNSSSCHSYVKRTKPLLTRPMYRKGLKPTHLKIWMKHLLLGANRLARHRAWYQLFSLLPLSVASVAARALTTIRPLSLGSSRARGCPQHLLLWRDLHAILKAPYKYRPNTMVVAGISGTYTKYLMDFFEGYTKSQICLHFVPYGSNGHELARVRLDVNACIYPALKTFHRLFFYKDFGMLCALAFYQKNATLLITWITRFMERIEAKIHKKFLRFLSVFLRRIHESTAPSLSHTGIKITVKGKISVSGSAKKRTQHIAYGTRSLSRKSHRISFAQGLVRTQTGVLGVKCFIFY